MTTKTNTAANTDRSLLDEPDAAAYVEASFDGSDRANLPAVTTNTTVARYEGSQALAAFHGQEAAEWEDVDDGLIGWEAIGYSMPRLVADFRPGGGWTDESTGEKEIAELNVVILAMQPGRAYWKEPFGKGNLAPDCRSSDMLVPDAGSPDQQSSKCSSCPHAQFGSKGDGQACSTRINALVYDTDRQHFARTSFGVTAIKRVRGYVSGLKAYAPPRKLMGQVTHIGLESVERDGMKWNEPVLSPGEKFERGEIEPLRKIQTEIVAQWRSVLAEDMARPDADGTSVGEGPFDSPLPGHVPASARPAYTNPDEDVF